MKNSDRSSASSKRLELSVDDLAIAVEMSRVRTVRLTSKVLNNMPDSEMQIRELLRKNLLYCASVHGALCSDRDGSLLLWADIDHAHGDTAVTRERIMAFYKAAVHWGGTCRRHRRIKQSPLCRNEYIPRDLDLWRNVCDPARERIDSKDLDGSMARARQTIAQMESLLSEGREQLGRQADLLDELGITGDINSALLEAQGQGFRQTENRERQAVLGDIIRVTSNQLPVGGPRVSPTRQRV
ncbi:MULTISPECIES: CesT family type III secretion system chaperone [Mesorhizobium]|uniref:CesT family type III secretion system chaperone n=1 Tax=Mesorhizobium neociceri TaxID=1307853 RepID=A0A838BDD5_9HYPH|nr:MULTISPECIES: CesT family type III secretion system chaperone [Mesorhizobium]MBA1143901.1 CesT family type III secretion system chaperone [Mesorhizobium neociceri]